MVDKKRMIASFEKIFKEDESLAFNQSLCCVVLCCVVSCWAIIFSPSFRIKKVDGETERIATLDLWQQNFANSERLFMNNR